jgi:hypothetical protein
MCRRVIVLAVALTPAAGHALDADVQARALLLGSVERNRPAQVVDLDHFQIVPDAKGRRRLDAGPYLYPILDDTALEAFAGVDAEVDLTSWLSLELGADSGLLRLSDGEVESDGRPIAEEARHTYFLRTAWLELSPPDGPIGLGAGRRNVRLAGGLLFDEFATGAEIFGGFGAWTASLGGFVPGRDWPPDGEPFYVGEVAWAPDALSRVSLFAAMHHADGATARTLVQQVVLDRILADEPAMNRPIETRQDLCTLVDGATSPWWIGTTLDLVLEGHTLRGAGVLGFGSADVDLPVDRTRLACRSRRLTDRHVQLDLRSFAFDLTWQHRLSDVFYVGAFGLYYSGGRLGPNDTTYTAFLAINPYFDRPAVFFNAGLASSYEPHSHQPAGVEGRGVASAGPTLLVAPSEDLELKLLAAVIYADEPGPYGPDRHYGNEADASASWHALDGLALSLEGGAWRLGDFYPEKATVWQVRAGVQAEWPP